MLEGRAGQVLDEVVESIPREERVMIGADFNGHIGEGNRGDENVMGRYGDKARNSDGGGFRDKNGNGCGQHVFFSKRWRSTG